MIDREKIIRGLECCERPYEKKCDACPYSFLTPDSMECTAYLCKDALELLREQEPVRPIFDELDVCGCCAVCGHSLTRQRMFGENVLLEERFDYCPKCGRAVKWDDA